MWKPIEKLRVTDRDYSGMNYSYSYAEKHKNTSDFHSSSGKAIGITEKIEIKRKNAEGIMYRISGRIFPEKYESVKKFSTQFGEFGGQITTPGGKIIGGNFCFVFDAGNRVYAVSSFAPLMEACASIYQFSDENKHKCS